MGVPELTQAVYDVVNELNKLIGQDIPFKVNGDVVIHGKDIFFIKPGHMEQYLSIKLEKFNLILNGIHEEESLDIQAFTQKFSELTLQATEHYITYEEKEYAN